MEEINRVRLWYKIYEIELTLRGYDYQKVLHGIRDGDNEIGSYELFRIWDRIDLFNKENINKDNVTYIDTIGLEHKFKLFGELYNFNHPDNEKYNDL